MMLQTNLNYYPDVGRDARVEFGTLFFGTHQKTRQRYVWFEPAHGSLVAAQSQTDDATLRDMLRHFQKYVDSVVEGLEPSEDVTAFARDFLDTMPLNFRYGSLLPYPSEDFVPRLMRAFGAACVFEGDRTESRHVPA
jgi:hypothetical protein